MKILLITQYYAPVKGAGAKRTGKMAQYLTKAGHDVSVLTGFPSYPTGKLDSKYNFKLWTHERIDSIEVTRVWELPTSTQDGTVKRLLNMLSFAKFAAFYALFHRSYDAVIVSSPSFLSGVAGLWASKKKTRFFFDIRDLWPDSMIDMGVVGADSAVARWAQKLERKFYDRSNKIFAATPGIKKHLISEKIDENKIQVLLNSVDTDLFKPQPTDLERFDFQAGDFICGYVGNISRAYDMETVLKSAEILKKEPHIKFWIIGEGENKTKLMNIAKEKSLDNVVFKAETSLADLPPIVNAFSVGLAPIANIGVSQESFPSKTCEYFACAKPVLASLGGDMRKIIEGREVGLIYEFGNAQALAKAILNLYHDKTLTQEMGVEAHNLAVEMFSDKAFAEKLVSSIEK